MYLETLYDYLKLTVPNTFGVVDRGNSIEVGVETDTLYSDFFWVDDNYIKFSTLLKEVPDYIPKAFKDVEPHRIDIESSVWRTVYAFKIPEGLRREDYDEH